MAITRNTKTFTDLNLLFTANPATGDVTKKVDEEAIKSSIKNLIQTKNYERPFHPEIGCQVFSLLFENFTPVTREVLKKTIFDVIEKFEPRASVLSVKINETADNNDLNVYVEFLINNSDRPVTLKTTLQRVR
jgi:phage baseplate assembly protein W